jgi:protein SCO1/2
MKFNVTAAAAVVALCLCWGPLSADQANAPASDLRAIPDTVLMPATDSIPGTSLYQLPVTLETAEGAALKLSELRGQPLIVTMFYSHCTSVCPLLTGQLQRLMAELSPAERQQIRVLMVSFDSVRDTPQELKGFKSEHRIEDSNWFVSRASAADVRSLAAALGIRYRELPDHSFNHSAVISVADRGGTVRARTSELTGPDTPFIQAVRKQIVQQ